MANNLVFQAKANRDAIMAGQKTVQEQQAARDQFAKDAFGQSTTINRFVPTAPAQVQAQQDLNTKYQLPADTGLRTQALPSSAPTPANPMVEVSARGANVVNPAPVPTPTVQNPYSQQGSQYAVQTMPYKPQTTMTGSQEIQKPAFDFNAYMNMTPEEQLQVQSDAVKVQGRQQRQILNKVYDTQENQLAARQREVEQQLAEQKAAEEAANKAAEEKFKAEQAAQVEEATRQINRAAGQRAEQANTSLAFSGFSRSTKAADIQDNIRQDTQAQIADINRQSSRAVDEYRASLLDKTNAKLEKIQARIDAFGSKKDEVELQKVQAQGQLMMDLFKQDPLNPQNMVATAEKLQKMKIDKQKMDLDEQKAVRDDARKNFEFMINNFGSGYLENLGREDIINLSSNLGVSPQSLMNLPKTVAEIKQQWDESKYVMDKQFEIKKMDWQNQRDLEKLGIQFDYDMQKLELGEQFKTAEEQRKYANLSYGTFAGQAQGADGASLYFEQPTTVNGKQVIASNPKIVNAYPQGYRKQAGESGLGGQCAFEAQQIVTCPKLGNSLQEKLKTLSGLVQNGKAFYRGQGQPQVGNTIISNDSKKYGHVAVINSIKPDGTLVLSEFNRAAPLTYTNTREISPNDPSIYGFIASRPKSGYEVAKTAQQLMQDALKKNPVASALVGAAGSTKMGGSLEKIGTGLMKYFGADKTLINQAAQGEQAFDAGVEDESGAALTPDRQAVRQGIELPSETVKNLAQYKPQAYQQYMQDLAYSKTAAAKQKSMDAYNKPLDMNASKALGYAASAQQAETELSKVPDQSTLGELNNWLTRDNNPNALMNDKINELKSPAARAVAQTEMQWIANVLRQESGAAISAKEYSDAGFTYFPRPGDSQAELARKSAARQQKIEGLLLQAGPQGLSYFQSKGYNVPSGLTQFYGNQGLDMSGYQQAPQPQAQRYDPLGIGISQGGNDPLGLGL